MVWVRAVIAGEYSTSQTAVNKAAPVAAVPWDAAHWSHWKRVGGTNIEVLRVSGSSRPNSVAGAIAALLRNEGEVEVQAIGPHAVNQAVKAIAIARSYIQPEGLGLRTVPSFVKLELQEEERTAVRFAVESYREQPE